MTPDSRADRALPTGTVRPPRAVRPMRMLSLTGLGAAAMLVLAGCSSPSSDSTSGAGVSTPSASTSDGATLAPVVVDLDDAGGTSITVAVGGTVDLDTDDEADWSASIADSSLAEFIPGVDSSGTETNPGLRALAAGRTQVAITEVPDTDDTDDDTDDDLDVVEFTLIVTD